MQNLTDISTWTDPVPTVADGDAANAANFALGPQALANRTRYLYDTMVATSALAASGGAALVGATDGVIISGGTVAAQLSAIDARMQYSKPLLQISAGATAAIYLSAGDGNHALGTMTIAAGTVYDIGFDATYTMSGAATGVACSLWVVKGGATLQSDARVFYNGQGNASWHIVGDAATEGTYTIGMNFNGTVGGESGGITMWNNLVTRLFGV